MQTSSQRDQAECKLSRDLKKEQICSPAELIAAGDPELEVRLDVLLKSINAEARLHALGRFLASSYLRKLLETRAELERSWIRAKPERGGQIKRPVFITGVPRSGSTFLHELMAQDKNNRVPLAWEVITPIGRNARIRRLLTAASLWFFRQIAPGADAVHPLRAKTPHECVAIQSYSLLSREFTIMFDIPTYETFLQRVDFHPAYLWQKRFLQFLQGAEQSPQWVLKAPDHVFTLESLFRVFPDAMIIQTHRKPLDVIRSSTKLLSVIRRTFAAPKSLTEIGQAEARGLQEGLARITQFREEHPELEDRFLDVRYEELTSKPMETVRNLYRNLGLALNDSAVHRMHSLARARSRYSKHPNPSFRELGVDPAIETQNFRAYSVRFGLGHS